MNNLTTLSCPTCGATLQAVSGEQQISCKYCGNTHLLSNSAAGVTSHSVACPVDSHQDVILKVSAIVKTQVFETSIDSVTDKVTTYKSQLAQRLLCPPQPFSPFAVLMTRGGLMVLVFPVLFLFALLGNALFSYLSSGSGPCGFMLFLVIGILVVSPLAKNTWVPLVTKRTEEYQAQIKQWQVIKRRWDNSYYCQRHDIVFVPGYDQAIPPDKFQSFLQDAEAASKA